MDDNAYRDIYIWHHLVNHIFDTKRKDGPRKIYYSDGKLWSLENWKNNKRDGKEYGWYPSGQILYSKYWKNGKKEKLHTYWLASGQINHIETWENGILKDDKYFFNFGNKKR
jgi:antitoxin component YwqK of YwqJK toxin-antitoxin module